MPHRSPRPCRISDCPNLVYDGSGYCTEHKAEMRRQYDSHRGGASMRGYGTDWQQIRDAYIAAHPTCERCGQRRSEVVHHIVRKRDGGSDDPGNLLAVCKLCHAQIHADAKELFGANR